MAQTQRKQTRDQAHPSNGPPRSVTMARCLVVLTAPWKRSQPTWVAATPTGFQARLLHTILPVKLVWFWLCRGTATFDLISCSDVLSQETSLFVLQSRGEDLMWKWLVHSHRMGIYHCAGYLSLDQSSL